MPTSTKSNMMNKNALSIFCKAMFLSLFLFSCIENGTAQCNNADFKALRLLYDNTNGDSWTNTASWTVIANNTVCPSGFDMSTLPGITLNANDRIQAINLSNNNLTGTLPSSLLGLEELRSLNLSKNEISGAIPASLGDMPLLEILQLQENNLNGTSGFTGSIPITGHNFPSLRILRLNKNSLTGGIPINIGGISTLEELGIHNNNLGGLLPSSLGMLSNLTILKLFNNGLTGCFPPSYANICQQLTTYNIDMGNTLDATWAQACVQGMGICTETPFITTWKTDNAGSSCSSCITVPVTGGFINFDVDWDYDGVYDTIGVNNDFTHDFGTAGTYTIAIRGNPRQINFDNSGDREKLLSIDQWGDIEWNSMFNSFYGCTYLTIPAVDAPDLSGVPSMSSMLRGCDAFNQDISHWDVSNVTDMSLLFRSSDAFNQDISNWDVSAVTNMSFMFSRAPSFNQDLSNWNVSNVENMSTMFGGASSFNQPLPWGTKTSKVTDMSGMFNGADIFNQDISLWDVSAVTDMGNMFREAGAFNQNISGWDVGMVTDMSQMFREAIALNQPLTWGSLTANVTSMSQMFLGATSFNQDISGWDVSSVTDMGAMFLTASAFNQDLSSWVVSAVTTMGDMFESATAFNQDLSNWNISLVTNMDDMLDDCGMDADNYDATLIGWANQTVQPNVSLGAKDLEYCNGQAAHTSLENDDGWNITDDTFRCINDEVPFVTTWKTDNPGTSCSSCITIPTASVGYDYDVDIDNDGNFEVLGVTGDFNYTFPAPGTYTIAIRGAFPRISFNDQGDKEKLLTVDQWGDIKWASMFLAFEGCSNLTIPAQDNPDLSIVTNMDRMFAEATSFNQNISDWDVSNVTNMQHMFRGAKSFNQPLDWDVSSVTDMSGMFRNADAFNQNISNWDVSSVIDMRQLFFSADSYNQPLTWGNKTSNVTDMSGMFVNIDDFNQDLSGWDVSNVTDMSDMFANSDAFNILPDWGSMTGNVTSMYMMFRGATSFNQDLSGWDFSSVTDMAYMFNDAKAFDQDLGTWDISNVIQMDSMLDSTNLSIHNYDQTLIGWSQQQVQSDVILGSLTLRYCTSKEARDILVNTHNWAIFGDILGSGENIWTETTPTNWNDTPALWSLSQVPGTCHNVIITSGTNITLQDQNKGFGATLEVEVGAMMEVEPGGALEIGGN